MMEGNCEKVVLASPKGKPKRMYYRKIQEKFVLEFQIYVDTIMRQ